MHLPLHEILARRRAASAGQPERPRSHVRWLRHLAWILPLAIFDVWLIGRWRAGCSKAEPKAPMAVEVEAPSAQPVVPWSNLVFPTAQTNLLGQDPTGVYQPTASGNPESALYGSVRTGSRGGRLVPTFHEGLDIAACRRDRQGRPLDAVRAVADGTVAHVNRVGGNSNYGIYVVLLHNDPMGEVYTLYAHLMRVAPGIKPGHPIRAGDVLGEMGNTSSSPMPMARAHLHFEIGLIVNRNFAQWFRSQKLKPDHGTYHGWNLLGLDPMAFLRFHQDHPDASFLAFMDTVAPAFEVILAARRKPDFFERYPALWTGGPPEGAILVVCSDNGVPLCGRAASSEEQERLGRQKAIIARVDETVMGRNGSRLIARKNGEWVLAQAGEQWREILLYPH